MNLRELVRQDFEEFIRIDPSVPEELRRSLRLKERVPQAVDNLAEQLALAEKQGIIFTREKIKSTVYSMTAQFVHLLKTTVHEQMMSANAKTVLKNEIEGDPILSKFDKDGNADLSDEFGVIISEPKLKLVKQ